MIFRRVILSPASNGEDERKKKGIGRVWSGSRWVASRILYGNREFYLSISGLLRFSNSYPNRHDILTNVVMPRRRWGKEDVGSF